MITEEHCQILIDIIVKENLKVPFGFPLDASIIAKVYNGIGPDWMDEKARDILTKSFDLYEPAAMIHDWMYSYNDKSKEGFDLANAYFYSNCVALVKAQNYGVIDEYWKIWVECEALYKAVQDFGWDAYLN